MFRNEWLKCDELNFKPWDVGYLGDGSLGITVSNKSTGCHTVPRLQGGPTDVSLRPCYSRASLYHYLILLKKCATLSLFDYYLTIDV